jgi:hypothetical protein
MAVAEKAEQIDKPWIAEVWADHAFSLLSAPVVPKPEQQKRRSDLNQKVNAKRFESRLFLGL